MAAVAKRPPDLAQQVISGGQTLLAEAPAALLSPAEPKPLRLLFPEDLDALPKRDFLLATIFARRELSVLWGAPKSGKSFLAMRLGYGLACGIGMWGLTALACRVIYVAAEGAGGLRNRVGVLRKEIGEAQGRFAMIAQRVQIGFPSIDVIALIELVLSHRADLLVIDTLARTFGEGDENSTMAMNAFVAALDAIREETGVHVMVIHHGAKSEDATTPRGAGALVGAADLVAKVSRGSADALGCFKITDAKDDVSGRSYGFVLETVELEAETDGKPRQSMIARETEDVPRDASKVMPSGDKGRALEILQDLLADPKHGASGALGVPADLLSANVKVWRQSFYDRAKPGDDPETKRKAFNRARDALIKGHHVACHGDLVWVVRP